MGGGGGGAWWEGELRALWAGSQLQCIWKWQGWRKWKRMEMYIYDSGLGDMFFCQREWT